MGLLRAVKLAADTSVCSFFFNDTATTEIYTLSLHDALPIFPASHEIDGRPPRGCADSHRLSQSAARAPCALFRTRSEEHTSELQSHLNLVCRLLLEKKNMGRMGTHGRGLMISVHLPTMSGHR